MLLTKQFLLGALAGALIGLYWNDRDTAKVPEPGSRPHAGYARRMR